MYGGAFLKLTRVLLVLTIAAIFSAMASADPIDPKITINKGGGSPTTTSGSTRTDPLTVYDGTGVNDFLYEGPATNWFYVLILPSLDPHQAANFPDEVWTCDPGIALTCGTVLSSNPNGIEFAFNAAQGVFVPGLDIVVLTPEPNVLILLLFGGLGVVFLAGRKKLVSLNTAA